MDPLEIVTGAAYVIYTIQSIELANQHFNIKKKAEKYWQREDIGLKDLQKRYDCAGKELPKISILVPAKNESDVIRHTINSISEINYPTDKLDLFVITDEREDMEDLDAYFNKRSPRERKTTLEITKECSKELYQEKGFKVTPLSVPVDFDGHFPGRCTGRLVEPSKGKGRPLNFCLGEISDDTDFVGVYDADANPDPDVCIGVANEHLKDPSKKIFQGPVPQIGNYNSIGLSRWKSWLWNPKTISLYQSITHEWYYPLILEEEPRMTFLGGTNYYIKTDLLKDDDIRGFNPSCKTEDWNLGARLWAKKNEHASFNPYREFEQTPATFKDFLRQRERWRDGDREVSNEIKNGDYTKEKKKEFRKWHLKNELKLAKMQMGAIASPGPALVLAAIGRLPDISQPLFWGYTLANAPAILYPNYIHSKQSKYIEGEGEKSRAERLKENVKLTVSSIPTASLSSVPLFLSNIKHAIGKGERKWNKTPRTRNVDSESFKDNRVGEQTFEEVIAAKGMKGNYAMKQLSTYFHEDPEKSKFYSEYPYASR